LKIGKADSKCAKKRDSMIRTLTSSGEKKSRIVDGFVDTLPYNQFVYQTNNPKAPKVPIRP
jgi:hypothetical protein